MDTLGDMKRTGHKVSGPSSDLVELENDKGLRHTGLTFHRKFRDHPLLTNELLPIMAFLEQPNVADLMEVVSHVPEAGTFIYPTGSVVALSEVLDTLAKLGEPAGVKAGLEACYFVAQILQDAYVKAESFELFSHGDLSPWRILLKADGRVQIIGFGFPQMDMVLAQESERVALKEDSYRYCPPERIEGEGEDFTSDLYSLALMAFELMTGEPLFNGVLSEIKQQATNAQGPYRLYQYRESLPESVVELLSRCLKFDMDTRHGDINEFIWEVRDLLALPEVEGPSLEEVATKVKNRIRRRREGNSDYTEEDLEDFAREAEGRKSRKGLPEPKKARPGEDEPQDQGQRWGRVARSGARDSRRGGRAAAGERPSLRERLKRSSGREPSADPKSSRAALKDRLKRSRGREEPPSSRSRDSLSRSRSVGRSRDEAKPRASRDRETPRRSKDAAPAVEEPSLGRSGRAASLLKRLRSSKGAGAEAQASHPSEGSTGQIFRVQIDDLEPISVRVSEGEAIGCLAARALEQSGGQRHSLTGALEGWFSVEQNARVLSRGDLVDALEPDSVVHLVFTAAALVCVDFEVLADTEIRFRAPVSTALVAGAALEQVLTMLELDGSGWHIAIDDMVLHALQPLGEVVQGSGATLVVSK